MKDAGLTPCKQNKTDCFAYRCGGCNALGETTFNKPCPFYKKANKK